jgi:glycosyltransferase involved in cell wall biosynthesis
MAAPDGNESMVGNGISFVVPCYQCADTVEESVESIFNGNFSAGDEALLVEDGSGDGTWAVLERLKERWGDRVVLLRHEKNLGCPAARNTAMRAARHGRFFCLDADNVLVPGSIPLLSAHQAATHADIASFGGLHYFQSRPVKAHHEWIFKPGRISLADCLVSFVVPPPSGNFMLTREIWERTGGYPEFGGAVESWAFGLWALAKGARMEVLPGTYYWHRFGMDSLYVRDHKAGKLAALANRVIEPLLPLLVEEDAAWVRGEGSQRWYFELEQRPLHLRDGSVGTPGRMVLHRPPLLRRLGMRLGLLSNDQ